MVPVPLFCLTEEVGVLGFRFRIESESNVEWVFGFEAYFAGRDFGGIIEVVYGVPDSTAFDFLGGGESLILVGTD